MDVLCASSCFQNDASHQLFFFLKKSYVAWGCLFAPSFSTHVTPLLFVVVSSEKKKKEHERERESTQLSSPNMATDEELEAKKVNDTTPTEDKAPEQPEKKKKDVATAILERKKAPNRLVVGEFFF